MWTPTEMLVVICVALPMFGGIVVAAILAAKGNSAGALSALQGLQAQQLASIQDRLNAHGQQITTLAQNQLPPAVQAAVVQNAMIPPPPPQPPPAPLQVLAPSPLPSGPATTGVWMPAGTATTSSGGATIMNNPPLTQGTPHA